MDEKPNVMNNNKEMNEIAIETPIETPIERPLSDPIFKKLSTINGFINNMTIDELRQQLNQMSLEDRYAFKSNYSHLCL